MLTKNTKRNNQQSDIHNVNQKHKDKTINDLTSNVYLLDIHGHTEMKDIGFNHVLISSEPHLPLSSCQETLITYYLCRVSLTKMVQALQMNDLLYFVHRFHDLFDFPLCFML